MINHQQNERCDHTYRYGFNLHEYWIEYNSESCVIKTHRVFRIIKQ